jgi:hypothetical protein
MTASEIGSAKRWLDNFIDPLQNWLFAAVHPVRTCRELLSESSDKEKVARSIRLLATSFLVSLVVNIPLYHPFGIGLIDMEFHLAEFLYLTIVMVSGAFAIQASLLIYRIKAPFSDVAAIYTVYAMSYQPVINLLCYFSSFRFLSLLNSAKAQKLDLDEVVKMIVTKSAKLAEPNTFSNDSARVCSWLLCALLCITSALITAQIADRYSISKRTSFSAVSFAVIVILPPVGLLEGILLAYFQYTFMSVVRLAQN